MPFWASWVVLPALLILRHLGIACALEYWHKEVLNVGVVLPFTGIEWDAKVYAAIVAGATYAALDFQNETLTGPAAVIIPNPHPLLTTVNFTFVDSMMDAQTASGGALYFALGLFGTPRANAIIGSFQEDAVSAMAVVTGLTEVVQVAVAATNEVLTDRIKYPYLFRVSNPDIVTGCAMWDYARFFQWRRIAVVYQDNEYGQAVSKGLRVSVEMHNRGLDLVIWTVTDAGGADATEPNVSPACAAVGETVAASDLRLVLFVFRDDFVRGQQCRKALLDKGVAAPKFQFLTTVYGVATMLNRNVSMGHTYWHGLYFNLDTSTPSWRRWISGWLSLTPEKVMTKFRSLTALWPSFIDPNTEALVTTLLTMKPPDYVAVLLEIYASFAVIMMSFNQMLHDGLRPCHINGVALREYLLNVSFQGFGKDYKFNSNQDVVNAMQIHALEGFASDGHSQWQNFAMWAAIDETKGEVTMLDDHGPGPLWATGLRARMPPEELSGCFPGYYLKIKRDNHEGECLPCNGGHFSTSFKAMTCELCPNGTYSNAGSGNCTPCLPGHWAEAGSWKCQGCPRGSFTPFEGQSACIGCSPGQHQSRTGQTACKECRPGTASSAGSKGCSKCKPGYHSAKGGSSTCEACGSGLFRQASGGASCSPCEPGSYSNMPGSSHCVLCQPGLYQANASSAMRCEHCPMGTYSDRTGKSACVECAFGVTHVLGADSSSRCECAANTFLYTPLELNAKGEPEPPKCLPCSSYMEPCEGGNGPARQKPGFHVSRDGRQAYQCASMDTCPGGLLWQCPDGSFGRGCASCDKGSYYWDGSKCSRCSTLSSLFLVLLPLSIVVPFALTYQLGNDPIGQTVTAVSEFIILLGMSLSVFFFLGAFAALDVRWDEPVATLIDVAKMLSTELTHVHFTCSVDFSPAGVLAMTSSVPVWVALMCSGIAFFGAASATKLFNTYGTLMYATYLLLLLHTLRPFRYIVHPTGERSVLFMPSVFDGSREHGLLVLVGLGALLLVCVPFATACIAASVALTRSRSAARRRWYLTNFRFLFYKFKPCTSYWGACTLLRNTAFAVSPSLWPDQPTIAIFVLQIVSITSLGLTGFISPWRSRWMNIVEAAIFFYMALILNLATGWVRRSDSTDGLLASILVAVAIATVLAGASFASWLLLRVATAGRERRSKLRAILQSEFEAIEQELSAAFIDPKMEISLAFASLIPEEPGTPADSISVKDLPEALLWVSRQRCRLDRVAGIAHRMRKRKYTLQYYFEDCLSAFPELQLYGSMGGKPMMNLAAAVSRQSVEGMTPGQIELRRTFGALFCIYWICRLDMDGKQAMTFGVEDENPHVCRSLPENIKEADLEGLSWGQMTPEQRRLDLYLHFNWELLAQLFREAGVTRQSSDGVVSVDDNPHGRLVALLCLTSFHDIMKNPDLCPRVSSSAYKGFGIGEKILDHDLALAYVLDRFPETLPSYALLHEDQRQVVRFTQSDMGFNAGWLVQAEGPPSSVLGKLKEAICETGHVASADVAFYFAHWVTDLAGAEPSPFRGSEKFAVKFPPHVLQGLLGCFSIVKSMANANEVDVYEEYLEKRWRDAADSLGTVPEGPGRTARLRLHCMAQQAAKPVLNAFEELSEADRIILTTELSATGLEFQHFSEWGCKGGPGIGGPFLQYYSPAWCQRIGESRPLFCLQVLAAVFREARRAFPEQAHQGFRTCTIHMGVLKSIDVEVLQTLWNALKDRCFEIKRENALEGTLQVKESDLSILTL